MPWTATGPSGRAHGCHSPTRRGTSTSKATIPASTLNYVRELDRAAKGLRRCAIPHVAERGRRLGIRAGTATCVVNLTEDVVGHEGLFLEPWQAVIL